MMKISLLVCAVAAVASASRESSRGLNARDDDLDMFSKRRIADLAEFPDPTWFGNISTWLDAQKYDGTWSDVNYLSGCPAQRANWPIQQHWNRIITFAAAWSGANPSVSQEWKNNDKLYAAISKALDYWFDNDYTPDDCIGWGGYANKECPCGTPGLWNTNWYDQSILIPQLCSISCLILKDAPLSDTQRAGCERIPKRAYDLRDGVYGSGGRMTGANTVLVMQNSVSLGLFLNNATITKDAVDRAFDAMKFSDKPRQDGIHRDGSFFQHDGILYNGNYGKDLFNAFIQLEGEAIGTKFAAVDDTRESMATYIRGNEWMIYIDQKTRRELWDFNAIGRFVAFPSVDLQANSDINFNVSKLAKATADFTGPFDVSTPIRRLSSNGTEKLTGNKGFWANDYMVHRRDSFVIGNKMLSKRTRNSEGVNSANPLANHLGQGTLFSYVEGDEYKDIMGAWNWNLVPGTTTLLNNPKLSPSTASSLGKTDFVGVVSDGKNGVAAEDYVEPFSASLTYRKTWFHFDDAVIVTTSNIKGDGKTPVITVLDNRNKAAGGAYVDGKRISSGDVTAQGSTLFYGGNGYLSYQAPFDLTISEGDRTGNWSEISTSKVGVVTVPLFSAYTTIASDSSAYAFFPATNRHHLAREAKKPTFKPVIANGVSAVLGNEKLGVVFWPGGPKSITVDLKELGWAKRGNLTVESDQPGALLLTSKCKKPGRGMRLVVNVADPTQKLDSLSVTLTTSSGKMKQTRKREDVSVSQSESQVNFSVSLPTGGMAGSTVSRDVYLLVE